MKTLADDGYTVARWDLARRTLGADGKVVGTQPAGRHRTSLPARGSASPSTARLPPSVPRGTLRVLGIDPALRTTDRRRRAAQRANVYFCLIEAGIVVPRVQGTLEQRLCELHAGIVEVIQRRSSRNLL